MRKIKNLRSSFKTTTEQGDHKIVVSIIGRHANTSSTTKNAINKSTSAQNKTNSRSLLRASTKHWKPIKRFRTTKCELISSLSKIRTARLQILSLHFDAQDLARATKSYSEIVTSLIPHSRITLTFDLASDV
jgi:hypothetical protein